MGPRLQREQAAAERDAKECGQAGGHAHERGIAQALPAQPKHAAGHATDRRAAQRQQRRLRPQAAACAGKATFKYRKAATLAIIWTTVLRGSPRH